MSKEQIKRERIIMALLILAGIFCSVKGYYSETEINHNQNSPCHHH